MADIDKYMQKNKYFQLRGVSIKTYKKYRLQRYLKNILPKDNSTAILDIGCGLGQTLLKLKEEGYTNIEGIDISEESCKCCALQKLKVKKIKKISEFSNKTTKQYDFIIMNHVIEHLKKEEIVPTLKIIKERLLSKKGQLCIMVPNAQSNTGCYWMYEDFTHNTLFTTGSLLYILGSAGFKKIKFLDPKGIENFNIIIRAIKNTFLPLYKSINFFWNAITGSSYHKPSPQIFTYELKVLAEN